MVEAAHNYNLLPEDTEEIEGIDEIVKSNSSRWMDALKTRDPEKVAEIYSEQGTLLATFSGKLRKGRSQIKEYFEHFLQQNPTCKITEEDVSILGDTSYSHCGMYTFEVDSDNDRQVVDARFTFVWKMNNHGKWEIVNHHSSVKPKG